MKKIFFLCLLSLVLLAGCITGGELFEKGIIAHYGNSNTGWHSATGQELENPVKSDERSLKSGKDLFLSLCASCHGDNAKGGGTATASMDPKPANLALAAKEKPASYLYLQMSQGRLGMPIWKKQISENERWDIVNYLKSLN